MRQNRERNASSGFGARHLSILLLGLGVLAACTTSNSGLTTVYYNVPGTTVDQINEQITLRGPQNGHAIGTTETRMTPRVKTRRDDGSCQIENADVKLDLTVTLPQWSELSRADGRTRSAFESLSGHVEWHEQQHVEISQDYAARIEKALAELPAEETCRELMAKARVMFKAMFEEHNAAQRAFDASEREAIETRLRALGLIG
ncbi:MAG: DUF922 domain-containing protein [Pseudomonadota bacterium]